MKQQMQQQFWSINPNYKTDENNKTMQEFGSIDPNYKTNKDNKTMQEVGSIDLNILTSHFGFLSFAFSLSLGGLS